MFRFDYYCRKCGYEAEKIVAHSTDAVDCPICESPLEKVAGGCNISTTKAKPIERPKDIPTEISTPLGRAEHVQSFEFKNEVVSGRASIYRVREARLGDPEMN